MWFHGETSACICISGTIDWSGISDVVSQASGQLKTCSADVIRAGYYTYYRNRTYVEIPV